MHHQLPLQGQVFSGAPLNPTLQAMPSTNFSFNISGPSSSHLGHMSTSQITPPVIQQSQQIPKAPKPRQKKKCAACRDANCNLMSSCNGSGKRKWCTCVMTKRHGAAKR